jgi:hypothetical protein
LHTHRKTVFKTWLYGTNWRLAVFVEDDIVFKGVLSLDGKQLKTVPMQEWKLGFIVPKKF